MTEIITNPFITTGYRGSGKFIRQYGLLSASSVKFAVPASLDKSLLTNDFGVYQVYDKFLGMWLTKNY